MLSKVVNKPQDQMTARKRPWANLHDQAKKISGKIGVKQSWMP